MRLLLAATALCYFTYAPSLFAQEAAVDTAKDDLKSCIRAKTKAEKDKSSLTAPSLLASCDEELRALLALIPTEMHHDIRHFLEDEISERLSKRL